MAKLPDKERAIKDLREFEEKLKASEKQIEEYQKEKAALELKMQTLRTQNDSYRHGVKYFTEVLSNLSTKIEHFERNSHRAEIAAEINRNKFKVKPSKLVFFEDAIQTQPNTDSNENFTQTKEALEVQIDENDHIIQKTTEELFKL